MGSSISTPTHRRSHRGRRIVAGIVITCGSMTAVIAGSTTSAHAASPGVGTPTVVAVGDSYISGEAGRWAGNSDNGESSIDALGSTAYFDNATHTAETINRCHRSVSDESYIAGGVAGLDLACSGAKTATYFDSSGNFKPGLDFYSDSNGNQGQALLLQEYASTHNVTMVQVAIGGNNFNFASIVQSCVTDFLTSPSWWPHYCKSDSSVTSNFTSSNVSAQTDAIVGALRNIRTAMSNAGYTDSMYTIVTQTYPSPVPTSSGFRYSQSGFIRQSTGGCGFWNADANWANSSALPTINASVKNAVTTVGATNVKVMDLSSAFNGRRLCENTVGLTEEKGLSSWRAAGAVDQTEWINQIRTISTIGSDYYIQESIHPNYWGQLAMRNCVRQAYNGGTPRGGTCTIEANGLDSQGEPIMLLH
jgi:hypothetical protein